MLLTRRCNRYLTVKQRNYILPRLKKIIAGKPGELERFLVNLKKYFRRNRGRWKPNLEKVFNYEYFSRINAYKIAEQLAISVCPYCNRSYTFTVTNGKDNVVRPDFDHFLSQEDYPLFAISFYNLTPCCNICNSRTKGRKKFKASSHVHPYMDEYADDMKFSYTPNDTASAIGMSDNLLIDFKYPTTNLIVPRIKKNVEDFRLDKIYQGHKDVVSEIIKKKYLNGGAYFQSLENAFPSISSSDLYNMAFSNFDKPEDFEKRPLAKLTKDIVDELKFLI